MNPLRKTLNILALSLLAVCSASAEDITIRVEVDRKVLPAGQKGKAIIKVSLGAPKVKKAKRAGVNLAIVLDRSGSMAGEKLVKAKEAAIEALKRLGPADIFSLVIYDHQIQTLVPAQSAANAESIIKIINSISSGGNTALFGGVSQGAAEVRKNIGEKYVHRVILLSDGLANVGPSSPQDLERLGRALIKENISVTTVGVGTDYNEDLMTRLSQASDGNAYFVQNSKDLPKIFTNELGDVLSVVARKVIIEIECPGGVTPIRIIGREGRIKGNKVELYLNQLYGGQEKYVLLEVEVPATEEKEKRRIATARVNYENLIDRKKSTVSGEVSVSFSRKKKEVIASANKKVQVSVGENGAAIALDVSVDLMDQGKKKEAVYNLRFNAANLRDQAATYYNGLLLKQAEELEREAEVLEKEGMSKAQRKTMRNESYRARAQQKH